MGLFFTYYVSNFYRDSFIFLSLILFHYKFIIFLRNEEKEARNELDRLWCSVCLEFLIYKDDPSTSRRR